MYNEDYDGDTIDLTFTNRIQLESIFGSKLEKLSNMDLINFYEHHIGSEYHMDCSKLHPEFLKMKLSERIDNVEDMTKASFDFTSLVIPKKVKIYDYLKSLF